MKKLATILTTLVTTLTNPVSGNTIEVNQPFPTVVLPSAEDGAAMSLEQFRGQKFMLHIFASW